MIKAKWKKLDLDTCIIVRRLRLNKRGRHAGKKIKESLITNGQGSTNQNNLSLSLCIVITSKIELKQL